MVCHELGRLDEHTTAAAAGIVDPAVVGLQNLHQGFDHAGRGIEFYGQLAIRLSEFGQAIFIGTAPNVLAVAVLHHLNIGK